MQNGRHSQGPPFIDTGYRPRHDSDVGSDGTMTERRWGSASLSDPSSTRTNNGRAHTSTVPADSARSNSDDTLPNTGPIIPYWSAKHHLTCGNTSFRPSYVSKLFPLHGSAPDKLKTANAALVLCLNIDVDPPDVIKTTPPSKPSAPTSSTNSKASPSKSQTHPQPLLRGSQALLHDPLQTGQGRHCLLLLQRPRRTQVFTAVTDTIARTTFPPDIFTRLAHHEELPLHPAHAPRPPVYNTHQFWAAWDLAVDTCLRQLPNLLEKNTVLIPPNPNPGQTRPRKGQQQAQEPVQTVAPEKQHQYVLSRFVTDQLTACEVWISDGLDGVNSDAAAAARFVFLRCLQRWIPQGVVQTNHGAG
ncbi:hypothetical protein CONPUDRAFT_161396 [Coniophora puteana RWD-64-598 SS2]|uniref:Uncharacterized protein n=1 Tax=Coniophora puteana (strain RWD-64-598) TaxID=741705 RepID=A0A5M3N5N9_CONPW|nr:uncharacterized protein CONPUDRAFT_161396 [Coniophora puteana RWD-64-598 SS2]EIW86719.1 hypothetical protein CONPUDRAFT_161396 [Coniophora puteana RWD-64-598 SS2]